MKCQGRFGKSTVYFINEGFQRGFVKTDGEVFQKDVNGNLETASPQQRNHRGKKGKCCQAAVNKENHRVYQYSLHT